MSVWNVPTAMNNCLYHCPYNPRYCAVVAPLGLAVFMLILFLVALCAVPYAHAAEREQVPATEQIERPSAEVGIGSETKLPIPRFASLKSENVYVRTGPSMDYPIKWIYKRAGLPVEIIQEFDAWRRIRDPAGDTGWVHKILLSGHRSAMIRGHEAVPAFEDHDLVEEVAKLEPKFIVTIHECDARACLAQFAPYEGWIEKKYLWGVYGSEIFQ